MEAFNSPSAPTEFETVNIKDLNQEELLADLIEAGVEWSPQEKSLVIRAYGLANYIHRNEEHRGQPYIFHPLRVANRITKYLHLTNPHRVAGALLHDTVEHSPDEVIKYVAPGRVAPNYQLWVSKDPAEKQLLAFHALAQQFSVRTSRMVQGMTHPPSAINKHEDREAWLDEYVERLAEDVRDEDVFLGRWADWSHNGLGWVFGTDDASPEQRRGYNEKYGRAMLVLEERFYHIDIQTILDETAKANVIRSFELAHERLDIPDTPRELGRLVINAYEPA
jgi:hypothetical protein